MGVHPAGEHPHGLPVLQPRGRHPVPLPGCAPCTNPICSRSRNPEEIIQELRTGALSNIAERSGRAQDAEDGGGLETLRRGGYM